jgi:protein phosphatase PTC7
LALQARRLALDEQYMSPFALKASEQGIDTCGGKVDDITLVLLLISSSSAAIGAAAATERL